jgi:hypothetical protein
MAEQMASLFLIQHLQAILITKVESVYCAVRTESLYKTRFSNLSVNYRIWTVTVFPKYLNFLLFYVTLYCSLFVCLFNITGYFVCGSVSVCVCIMYVLCLLVCVYVCMCTYYVCMYVCVYVCVCIMFVVMYVCMYVCWYVCTCIYV